jgi:Protein of unknown function (DUF1552)
MRLNTKKYLSRRTVLQGMGVTVALPLLDSMVPAQTPLAKTAAQPLSRFGFVYIPHGKIMNKWTPTATGKDFELTPILKSMEPVRDHIVVVSGLSERGTDGGHSLSPSQWLTGVMPKHTDAEDIEAAKTMDQLIADKIGQDNPFPSIELATEDLTGLVGACEGGYSCSYMNTISWRTPTTPLPMEINPRVVFERMFGGGGSIEKRLARLEEDRSILDSITQRVGHLKTGLPSHDRARMDEYLDNVREIERRIQKAEKQTSASPEAIPEAPIGVPDSFDDHAKLMFDLLALAYEANLTRVFTFMMARELSGRTYPQIGVPDPHHAVSHHQNDPVTIAKHEKINTYHVSLLAGFIEKLSKTQDGDGTLLDHSLIVYGSGMGNGNVHSHDPLPALVMGGGMGQIHGGRHIVTGQHVPIANLMLSVAQKAGLEMTSFGNSTGPVDL